MHGKVYDYGFNIRDLRRVIAVAEHRSLRQAALALEVDQGTLTRSIQALEPDPKVFEQYQPVVIHPSLRRDGVNGDMDWYCPT
ncbi:LysR family transcriptional regulator [Gluconacetobacter diazotrophicus]|uniref:LysR family transcriptional regulator n=1 Tax=Gluconacetobacter diazotrophicus TaxID=33996 RepID=A0A7W4I920_GLUDI|nr:LysR family transcriptional regulator [Gluconacetobacter diazotrophicus]MBB2158465.1 LysR family transcriptional regulator [Gluconacetobacter diazotrophicus]